MLFFLPLALASVFFGCALTRTEYVRPETTLPGQWEHQPESGEKTVPAGKWWEAFQDPALSHLIESALKTNNNLAAAAVKVRKARLEAGLAATALTPDLSVSAGLETRKDLDSGSNTRSADTSVSLSYEVDLWGKLAASRDSAEWEARATDQDRAATALSLVGTTADLYWEIAYRNQAVAISFEEIAYAEKTLALVEVKYRTGAVSKLDLLQAEQEVESQRSALSDLERQLATARSALAILFDAPPEKVPAAPLRLSERPLPTLKAGIPAAVLGNRPDLKAAEMRLRALLSDVDTTRASYYPAITLTSSLGTGSSELADILKNPVATLGAGLVLPFVQWNQARLNTRIAAAAYEAAVLEFRQSLYEALKEVEDALSAETQYRAKESSLQRSYALALEAERLAGIRYRSGAVSLQTWLDQQEARRTAELSLAENRYNRLVNLMTLYQAIGGDDFLRSAP